MIVYFLVMNSKRCSSTLGTGYMKIIFTTTVVHLLILISGITKWVA